MAAAAAWVSALECAGRSPARPVTATVMTARAVMNTNVHTATEMRYGLFTQ